MGQGTQQALNVAPAAFTLSNQQDMGIHWQFLKKESRRVPLWEMRVLLGERSEQTHSILHCDLFGECRKNPIALNSKQQK